MPVAYTQENRLMAIATPLGDDALLLTGLSGEEGASRLFRFDLELFSTTEAIDFSAIVGGNVTVRLTLADGNDRYLNGYVSRFSQGGQQGDLISYHAEVVPWLWFLTRTSDCRIFQNKKVPDIVKQIFDEMGFKDYKLQLYGDFAEREYCVQYRETDFNFVSRLLEEEGIFYFFEHEDGVHTLILANDSSAHKPCPNQPQARYEGASGGAAQQDDIIQEWRVQLEMRPGVYAQADYNFEQPAQPLKADVSGKNSYEIYDYHPGEYRKQPEGDGLVRTRLQELEAPCLVAHGSSDCRAFTSGYRFDLKEHYRGDMNQAWVLTSVRHSATQPGDFRAGSSSTTGIHYRNNFECIPYSTPFRPPRVTPHPVIQGSQTAVVVGPSGEEIFVDKYGRVKVQFHWDREGKNDENSSCWIRVSQAWAGKKWGAIFIPRIGQEVIVDFLEGDPDQPIITGRVYNAEQVPPYTLPDEKTKSTMKSLSSKGGGGFNEIRFEDKKDGEQIFIHGQKDLDVRIENDRKEWIGEDRHLIVVRDKMEKVGRDIHVEGARDQIQKIGRDHHLEIDGKSAIKIVGSQSVSVTGDVIEEFKANHSSQVTQNLYLKAMQVVIEAASGITLKVGGNFITIDPSGVAIKGTLVQINSAGAALSGSAGSLVSPLGPTVAQEADKADPGDMGQGTAGSVTRTPLNLSSASVAKKSAASNAPTHDPNSEENQNKPHWIEIELVDEAGQPVVGEPYQVTLPDGTTVADGTLDEKGRARVQNIDTGTCKVTFPNLDKEAWEPK
jgi:type VI secretion system secreted protein VgrG